MMAWVFRKIRELGTIVGGGTPSTKHPEFYSNSGIGWITPKDLSCHRGRFVSHGERDISPEGLRKSSARLMPRGTVLFSSRAPIGYVAIASCDLCTSQGFKSVVPNVICDSNFLYYLMRFYAPKIESIAGGSTFKEVSAKVPESIEEQRTISAALSAFDNKIELNWRINDNLSMSYTSPFNSFGIRMSLISDRCEFSLCRFRICSNIGVTKALNDSISF